MKINGNYLQLKVNCHPGRKDFDSIDEVPYWSVYNRKDMVKVGLFSPNELIQFFGKLNCKDWHFIAYARKSKRKNLNLDYKYLPLASLLLVIDRSTAEIHLRIIFTKYLLKVEYESDTAKEKNLYKKVKKFFRNLTRMDEDGIECYKLPRWLEER